MSVKCIFTSESSTSVWPQHGAGVAGSGRDFDPLSAVLDIIGRTWQRDEMIQKWTLWHNIQKEKGTFCPWPFVCVCVCVCVSACVRACQTDRAERWRAVSLYRVKLCCCVTTRIRSSHSCASAGSGPGSDDPGVVGCTDNKKKKALGNTCIITHTLLTQLFEHARYFTVQN